MTTAQLRSFLAHSIGRLITKLATMTYELAGERLGTKRVLFNGREDEKVEGCAADLPSTRQFSVYALGNVALLITRRGSFSLHIAGTNILDLSYSTCLQVEYATGFQLHVYACHSNEFRTGSVVNGMDLSNVK